MTAQQLAKILVRLHREQKLHSLKAKRLEAKGKIIDALSEASEAAGLVKAEMMITEVIHNG